MKLLLLSVLLLYYATQRGYGVSIFHFRIGKSINYLKYLILVFIQSMVMSYLDIFMQMPTVRARIFTVACSLDDRREGNWVGSRKVIELGCEEVALNACSFPILFVLDD